MLILLWVSLCQLLNSALVLTILINCVLVVSRNNCLVAEMKERPSSLIALSFWFLFLAAGKVFRWLQDRCVANTYCPINDAHNNIPRPGNNISMTGICINKSNEKDGCGGSGDDVCGDCSGYVWRWLNTLCSAFYVPHRKGRCNSINCWIW